MTMNVRYTSYCYNLNLGVVHCWWCRIDDVVLKPITFWKWPPDCLNHDEFCHDMYMNCDLDWLHRSEDIRAQPDVKREQIDAIVRVILRWAAWCIKLVAVSDPARLLANIINFDGKCFNNIRYGLVARISRSQTVLPRTIRSEEAGVQFPVSESSFATRMIVQSSFALGSTHGTGRERNENRGLELFFCNSWRFRHCEIEPRPPRT